MILSRRKSIITAVLVFFIALVFAASFPSRMEIFSFLFFSLLVLVVTFRVFSLSNLLYAILTPIIYAISTFFVFLNFPLISFWYKILLALVFSIVYYFLLLSINSLLVSFTSKRSFPLLRVGKTFITITTLFASFLAFTMLYKFETFFLIHFFISFLISFGLSFEYFWSQGLGREDASMGYLEPLLVSIVVTETSYFLSFYPTEAFFRALVASAVFYSLLGITQAILDRKISKKTYLEYSLIMTSVFLLLFIS